MILRSKVVWLGIVAVVIAGLWTLSLSRGPSLEPDVEREIVERQSILDLKAASFKDGLMNGGFDVIGSWAGDPLSPKPFKTEQFRIPSNGYLVLWYLDEWHPDEGDCIFSINVLDQNEEFDHVILLFEEDDIANGRDLEPGIYSLNVMSNQCEWAVVVASGQN